MFLMDFEELKRENFNENETSDCNVSLCVLLINSCLNFFVLDFGKVARFFTTYIVIR